eukprot:15444315-Alexandrium_andersonii.AAC.1
MPRSALPARHQRLHQALVTERRRPWPQRATAGARGTGDAPGGSTCPTAVPASPGSSPCTSSVPPREAAG